MVVCPSHTYQYFSPVVALPVFHGLYLKMWRVAPTTEIREARERKFSSRDNLDGADWFIGSEDVPGSCMPSRANACVFAGTHVFSWCDSGFRSPEKHHTTRRHAELARPRTSRYKGCLMNIVVSSDPSGLEGSNVRSAWVGDNACCGDLFLCVPFARRAAPQCMGTYECMYFFWNFGHLPTTRCL